MSQLPTSDVAAWWDPSHTPDTDVKCHTPDATKYHWPDGRQNERMHSGVKGVVIPRSTRLGGSLGFDANKPGVVRVDPEAPDGGATIDMGQLSKDRVKQAVATTQWPHEAYYNLAGRAAAAPAPAPAAPTPEPVPQPVQMAEEQYTQAVIPSLSASEAAAQPPSPTMNVPSSPEIPSLASTQAPQAPQPPPPPFQAPAAAPAAPNRTEQLLEALLARMAAPPPAAQPQDHLTAPDGFQVPLPPVQPAPPPPQPQAPQAPVTMGQPPVSGNGHGDWGLDMPWVTGPTAQIPKHQAIFHMPFGTMSAYYHQIIQNGSSLVLVYDTRYEAGQQFMPPANVKISFTVEVPALNASYQCSFGGQMFSLGCQDLVVLVIRTPKEQYQPPPPPPPSPVDTSLVQQEAALAHTVHPGLQQAMGGLPQ